MKLRPFVIPMLLVVLLGLGFAMHQILLVDLCALFRTNPSLARPLACYLGSTHSGVQALLNDKYLGTPTGAWSSWALRSSPLTNDVNTGLLNLVERSATPLAAKLDAHELLWKRTKNRFHLLQIFRLVRKGGNGPIAVGRAILGRNVGATDMRLRESFETRIDNDIEMTEADFIEILETAERFTSSQSTNEVLSAEL